MRALSFVPGCATLGASAPLLFLGRGGGLHLRAPVVCARVCDFGGPPRLSFS